MTKAGKSLSNMHATVKMYEGLAKRAPGKSSKLYWDRAAKSKSEYKRAAHGAKLRTIARGRRRKEQP